MERKQGGGREATVAPGGLFMVDDFVLWIMVADKQLDIAKDRAGCD